MEQKIYDTKAFPFENVDLGKPFHKNGMYFIKMYVSGSPIYIQPPKCFLKQGILKTGKKLFCDLVFSIEDNYFLSWLEKIEEIARNRIFENRKNWFETELDEHDIEQSLVSPYKMYKSGKCFVIRTNIPTTLDKCDLKIYDENENEIAHEDLKDDTNVVSIIELKGIKCSARNFQFIFDVRQMLVIKPVKIFEKCIINTQAYVRTPENVLTKPSQEHVQNTIIYEDKSSPPASLTTLSSIHQTPSLEPHTGVLALEKTDNISSSITPVQDASVLTDELSSNTCEGIQPPLPDVNLGKPIRENSGTREEGVQRVSSEAVSKTEGDGLSSKVTTLTCEDKSSPSATPSIPRTPTFVPHYGALANILLTRDTQPVSEICEIDFDLAEISNNDTVQIKPRNDVYYRMYKSAKQKAKEAKLVALSSYLEAKRIKTTYSLVDSSDDSSDNEDDASQSENKNDNDSGSEF
jgi:hypothetical protein